MGYARDDAARDAERAEEALDQALRASEAVGERFASDWRRSRLSPRVSVRLSVGAEDQPLFVFSLLLALDDDLDPDGVPWGEVEELQSDLRHRIAATDVDRWDWILTTETQAGAARR